VPLLLQECTTPPTIYRHLHTISRPAVSDGLGQHKSHGRMKRILEAGKRGQKHGPLHSTSTIESIGHRSIAKTKAHHSEPSRTNNRTVTTTRLAVLHVQDRPPPSLHARFTSPPPRIDFGHTFNTSLAPCMIKHSSQQDGLFAFPSRGGRWKAKQARAATRLPRHSSATDAVRCQLVMDFNPRAPGTCQVRGKRTF
jgi:hypothetical protein